MRFLATMACAMFVFLGAQAAAIAACQTAVTRTIAVGPSNGMHPRSGVFLSSDILNDREVVLTFDDGPLPGPTGDVLRTLDEHCLRATFFIVGSMARANPDMVRRIAELGHTVGVHTFSHANLSNVSRRRAIRQILGGYRAVENAIAPYRAAPFFRFPYLAESGRLRRYLAQQRFSVFSAPVIAGDDWMRISGSEILKRVMRRLRHDGKGVILLHDIKRTTARMLPQLLAALQAEGFKIVHLVPSALIPAGFAESAPVITAARNTARRRRQQNETVQSLRARRDAGRDTRRHAVRVEDLR